jgi:hypothetical protein
MIIMIIWFEKLLQVIVTILEDSTVFIFGVLCRFFREADERHLWSYSPPCEFENSLTNCKLRITGSVNNGKFAVHCKF